jgi:hypothetical protein
MACETENDGRDERDVFHRDHFGRIVKVPASDTYMDKKKKKKMEMQGNAKKCIDSEWWSSLDTVIPKIWFMNGN